MLYNINNRLRKRLLCFVKIANEHFNLMFTKFECNYNIQLKNR
jgi:hypothetical protein